MSIIKGSKISGKGKGKKLDFPTINIKPDYFIDIEKGVYIASIIINDKVYDGIANWGTQPTFDGNEPILEIHLFDYEEQEISSFIEVALIKKIREIIKFDSIEELKTQLEKDKKAALEFFDFQL